MQIHTQGSAKILVVEGGPPGENNALEVVRNHSPEGWSVHALPTGAEALDFLFRSRRASLPSLILLDLQLPDSNGLEVLWRLRHDARTNWIPVVMLAGSFSELDVEKSYARGASGFVSKSGTFQEFSKRLQGSLFYWLSLSILPNGSPEAID